MILKLKYFIISLIFIILSIPNARVSANEISEFKIVLEKSLNTRKLNDLENYLSKEDINQINKNFKNLISKFPNAKWTIKSNQKANNKLFFDLNIIGSNIFNNREYLLNSNQTIQLIPKDNKFLECIIINSETIIKTANNNLRLSIDIPNTVLTGSLYNIDIILKDPLDNTIIVGGIMEHQPNQIFEQTINLAPLGSGGIFKIARAPSKAGKQRWAALIAHPNGMFSITKSVSVIENNSDKSI
tara:strand:+ start:13533 stop:14261 length:729 start_codon:yes stop_codon:yes gene_type:complete